MGACSRGRSWGVFLGVFLGTSSWGRVPGGDPSGVTSCGVGGLIRDDGSSRIRNWELLLGLQESVHGGVFLGACSWG